MLTSRRTPSPRLSRRAQRARSAVVAGVLGATVLGLAAPAHAAAPLGSSLNGDAKSDLVSVDANGNLRAFANIDAFSFTYGPPTVIGTGWFSPNAVKLADLNGDGKDDLVSVDTNGDLRAWPNINAFGFSYGAPRVVGTGWTPARTFFADLDGDGKDEVISADLNGQLRAFPNVDGLNGVWGAPRVVGTGWTKPSRLKFADLNGDRKDDVISVDANGDLRAFPNIDALNFVYGTAKVVGTGWTPARTFFGDLNGDGKDDPISVDTNGQLRAFPNVDAFNFVYGAARIVGTGWTQPSQLKIG